MKPTYLSDRFYVHILIAAASQIRHARPECTYGLPVETASIHEEVKGTFKWCMLKRCQIRQHICLHISPLMTKCFATNLRLLVPYWTLQFTDLRNSFPWFKHQWWKVSLKCSFQHMRYLNDPMYMWRKGVGGRDDAKTSRNILSFDMGVTKTKNPLKEPVAFSGLLARNAMRNFTLPSSHCGTTCSKKIRGGHSGFSTTMQWFNWLVCESDVLLWQHTSCAFRAWLGVRYRIPLCSWWPKGLWFCIFSGWAYTVMLQNGARAKLETDIKRGLT